MRYSLEETIGDQAFSYLDKIHSPIFLVHRNGSIKRINRAARKLLSIAHVNIQEIEKMILFKKIPSIITRKNRLKVFATPIRNSDYTLIELIR